MWIKGTEDLGLINTEQFGSIVVKQSEKYAAYYILAFNCNNTVTRIAQYDSKAKCNYVLAQLFNALQNDCLVYKMPDEMDLPDLQDHPLLQTGQKGRGFLKTTGKSK